MCEEPAEIRKPTVDHFHSWDKAAQIELRRSNSQAILQPIDPGVNYFILKLESLGIRTIFSCEGHPSSFYITFRASYADARKIAAASSKHGLVEVDNTVDIWTVRLINKPATEDQKIAVLRALSDEWETHFSVIHEGRITKLRREIGGFRKQIDRLKGR